MDYYRLFPSIANNTLSNTDKLSIVIYSLRDEYVRTDGCQSKDCANAPATVSAERVASRYHEIFGTNLVYAESAYCPSYSLSADKATYTVSEGCGGATDNYDLLFKEGYYYKDGYAYVDVAIGSRFNGENGTIYNDYYTAADKTAVKTIADFPSAEEFLAFQITADNAKDFALYTLKFKASDANNYYFVEASKTERKAEEPATPAEQPTQGSQNCKDAANEASTETTDCAEPATPEGQPTETPAAPASEDAAPESSDDISYETDPDAPPCPRSNPYARCVE